jgi:hypothetical protein
VAPPDSVYTSDVVDDVSAVSSPRPLRTKVSGYATAVDSRLLFCADMASKRSVTAISIS